LKRLRISTKNLKYFNRTCISLCVTCWVCWIFFFFWEKKERGKWRCGNQL